MSTHEIMTAAIGFGAGVTWCQLTPFIARLFTRGGKPNGHDT